MSWSNQPATTGTAATTASGTGWRQWTVREFLGYDLLAVLLAALIAYPFAMNYAHSAASWVVRRLSQEAIIGTFAGLILVISVYEGGILGRLVAVTIGIFGGLMNKLLGMHAGVQFMAYYTAALFVPKLLS